MEGCRPSSVEMNSSYLSTLIRSPNRARGSAASSLLSALPRVTANNRFELWKLGITHVLNAAHGGLYCQGGPDFYGSSVSYLGVPAHDLPDFNISTYFSSAADFIHRALNTPGGT